MPAVNRLPRWRFGDDPSRLRDHWRRGGVVAIPTESSYGLAADACSRDGVEAIYRIKARERGKPLPVVISGREQLSALGVDLSGPALRAAEGFWPAALSVVLPTVTAPAAAASGATLAIRVPAHEPLRHLLADVGFGVTATSANRAGESPVLDPSELDSLLAGHPAWVVDGGTLAGGAPSTLVAPTIGSTAWRVLRHGRFDPARLPPLDPPA